MTADLTLAAVLLGLLAAVLLAASWRAQRFDLLGLSVVLGTLGAYAASGSMCCVLAACYSSSLS